MATSDQLTRVSASRTTRSFLSRTLSRRAGGGEQARHDAPKGPLGLTMLYEPDPGVTVTADLVFVHGLNGGSQSTWSKDNRASHFWPKEWLPLDDAFQDVRIHSFGYPSGLGQKSVLNVRDFASSLLAAVKDSPQMNERSDNARLIFVTHSMGGLVTKLAYIMGRQDPAFKSVVERVFSIFFLATPHHGSAIAQTLSNLLAVVSGGGAPQFVNDLLPLSPMLQSINEDFPKKLFIVEKNDAVMNLANERRMLLDADHRSAAMYVSPNDSAFLAVRNALASVLSAQRSATSAQKRAVAQEDMTSLKRFLGVSDAPDDDVMKQDSVRLPGSGEWLSKKQFYQAWRHSSDSTGNFLWLRGRPGAGKSVLAGQVINELRENGADCCFFFFQARDNTKATANACLRSLAWQMAILHPEISGTLLQLITDFEDSSVDKVDHQLVWRRIFLSGILKLRLDRPQFWVIDGMDECKGSTDMVQFLIRIQERWPLSVLVTCRDSVELHLTRTNANIRSEAISDEDTKGDISLFLESFKQLLPCPKSKKWPDPSTMASHIVKSSGGCFLWASLICSELREVASEREIDQVLDTVPSDMESLYSRILDDMSKARWGKAVATGIITWTTYTFRPLKTVEIQEPIEMETGGKLTGTIEDVIAKYCGSLVYVDKYAEVQLIHLTAREFLIGKGDKSIFTVTRAEGHRRLAVGCLQALTRANTTASRPRRTWTGTPFTDYASSYLFQHLDNISSPDCDTFERLTKFLESTSVLTWIEFNARNGNLDTVFQAGRTIKSLLHRRVVHSPPNSGNRLLLSLDKWGDDLIYLVAMFGTDLRRSPHSIHHIIPAFAPANSAIRTRFAIPMRGISIHGLSQRFWDDCLTTITFSKGLKPNAAAAGPGYFAIGMMHPQGKVLVYDDSIFQETYSVNHGEPVWRLAFSDSGRLLASAGAGTVRIWNTADGNQVINFKISSLCLALAFSEEDQVLLVATRQNQLVEWDLVNEQFYRNEPLTWTADLKESMQGRTPTSVTIGTSLGLLSVNYRGENIVLWDYMDERVFDVYEKETGSVENFGAHKLGEGSTTVTATVFSQAIDTHLLAATYNDGDMYVYDTEDGRPVANAVGANASSLSSSSDGRTLAVADSYGNLTLFDFETLKALYRVQFDTPIPLKGLVFTADSRRFIEIRGPQCRVWQLADPPRTDLREESDSDTISVSEGPHEIYIRTSDTQVINISAIACLQSSNAVFYAMEDGSIWVCDLTGETETQPLFVQTQGLPVNILAVDEDSSLLACGDLSGRVTARKVVRHHRQRQTAWEVQEPMIEDRSSQRLLKQIFVSGKHSRLFMSADTMDTMLPIPKQGEGGWRAQLPGSQTPHWATHPTNRDILIRMEDHGFSIYSWQNLEHIRTIPVSVEGTLNSLTLLNHPLYFLTSTALASDPVSAEAHLWDLQSLGASSDTAAAATPSSKLTRVDAIELVIGGFGSRLVVYTTDRWIASLDLAEPTAESLVRHFFVPGDWIRGVANHELLIGVGRGGEILFAKGSELAVIKRGLEVTEEGSSFSPRRGSSRSLSSAAAFGRRPGVPLLTHRMSEPTTGRSGRSPISEDSRAPL